MTRRNTHARCLVYSSHPRSSRAVHWLIGRSLNAGSTQANAISCTCCSKVNWAGLPERVASDNRSAIGKSLVVNSNHRCRHNRDMSKLMFNSRATERVIFILVGFQNDASSLSDLLWCTGAFDQSLQFLALLRTQLQFFRAKSWHWA